MMPRSQKLGYTAAYINLPFQLFLICNFVKRISPLKHSANLQKQKKEYIRFTSQSLGSKLKAIGFESFSLFAFWKKKKIPKEENKTCFPYSLDLKVSCMFLLQGCHGDESNVKA